jgi:galactose mutarotase-like enzyme
VDNATAHRATESHFHCLVEEFCPWSIEQSSDHVKMKTTQKYRDWELHLVRTLLLEGDRLTTRTELHCAGAAHLPFRWFAHPFFPLNRDRRCCTIPQGYTLAGSEGFILDRESVLRMNPTFDWTKGEYALLDRTRGSARFEVFQIHPTLSAVRATCDFHPSKVALWANDRTFSFEPFHESVLHTGESTQWSMSYQFIGEE